MSKFLFALAAFAAVTAVPAAANTTSTRIVRYADLDLGSATGRARLDQRLQAAARDLCGTAAHGDLAGASAVRDCRVATLAQVARPGAAPIAVAGAR